MCYIMLRIVYSMSCCFLDARRLKSGLTPGCMSNHRCITTINTILMMWLMRKQLLPCMFLYGSSFLRLWLLLRRKSLLLPPGLLPLYSKLHSLLPLLRLDRRGYGRFP